MAEPLKFKGVPAPTSFAGIASNSAAYITNSSSSLKIETNEELILTYEKTPFRILEWGPEGSGKTHFLCTCPEPILTIDTENRIPLIMPKFRVCRDCGKEWCTSDIIDQKSKKIAGSVECPHCKSHNIRLKDIRRILVKNVSMAQQAAQLFIDIAEKYHDSTQKYATIGVDNIGRIWDWSQNEYSAGKGKDINDHLDPRDDYKKINPEHNEKFRDKLLLARANIVFIAPSKPVYDKDNRFEIVGSDPEGQKHNKYSVDWIISSLQGESPGIDGKVIGNGIFTSYVTKNSLIAARIDPIVSLNFEKLSTLRQKLMKSCGVIFEEPKPEPALTPETPETPKQEEK